MLLIKIIKYMVDENLDQNRISEETKAIKAARK